MHFHAKLQKPYIQKCKIIMQNSYAYLTSFENQPFIDLSPYYQSKYHFDIFLGEYRNNLKIKQRILNSSIDH